jgi:hypothetical protein
MDCKPIEVRMSGSERYIENAVIRNPGAIGFPDADLIRNVRVGRRFGRVDVLLLPRSGQIKVVLVEAKRTVAADAASKVLGQLLMYYSGAMRIGESGLECYRNFARTRARDARSRRPVTGVALTGGMRVPEAWRHMESGEKLKPSCRYQHTAIAESATALYLRTDGDIRL